MMRLKSEHYDDDGNLMYFEVTSLISRQKIYRIIKDIDNVIILKRPKRWQLFSEDVFCVFSLNNINFEVWEPFADNDRYHIASKPLRPSKELNLIRDHIKNYKYLLF